MTDKEMTDLFLFGGRCEYRGQLVNIVGHNQLTGTYTAQLQNDVKVFPDVKPEECKKVD